MTPTEAYEAYYRALKQGDRKKAISLTAGSAHIPPEILKETVIDLFQGARAGRLAVLQTTFGEKIEKDCAVVICDGNKIHIDDYRAVYLLQESDEWKLLWSCTMWDLPAHALTDAQKDRFRNLEAWFESKKEKLPIRRVSSSKE